LPDVLLSNADGPERNTYTGFCSLFALAGVLGNRLAVRHDGLTGRDEARTPRRNSNMPRHRMTEKEKVYFFCLLFPLLWPFIPVLLLLDLIEAIKRGVQFIWQKLRSVERGGKL